MTQFLNLSIQNIIQFSENFKTQKSDEIKIKSSSMRAGILQVSEKQNNNKLSY